MDSNLPEFLETLTHLEFCTLSFYAATSNAARSV
jgi:hypothetical protein